MGVALAAPAVSGRVIMHNRPLWADVVNEIVRSSIARVGADRVWRRSGAVGVLAGPAPVVWVYGGLPVDELSETLSNAPDVSDVYVDQTRAGIIDALTRDGWARGDVMHQLVCDEMPAPTAEIGLAATLLGPDDLSAMRALLAQEGASDEVLRSSYSDDFFLVAAPVRVLGVRDGDGRLVGMAAVRRQDRGAMGFALAVAQDWRHRGIATTLVRAAVEQAFRMGATFVHAQACDRSVALLEACGFSRVGAWQQLVRE